MNREDIIKFARQVGLPHWYQTEGVVNEALLIKFATLVAQQEREACAKIAETPIGEYEVVVACGTEPTQSRIPQYANWQDIAKAIRARVREKV